MPALADKDVLKLLNSGDLIIHPLLDIKQIRGARIDLRLDNMFYLIRRSERPHYDPMSYALRDEEPETYCEKRIIPYGSSFVLHPGDYALAPLFEFIKLPKNIIGRLDGRSSLGRLGILVHSTAGSIDPGYKGPITIELINCGMLPVALYPLMRIATLILMSLTQEPQFPYDRGKYGKLQEFFSIESKLHRDEDLKIIHRMKRYV